MNTLKGLYAITDSTLMPDDDTLLCQVEDAILGGAQIIQYRDKSNDKGKRLRQANALKSLCEHHQRYFIINDDIELAFSCGASGVHLGQSDGSLSDTKSRLSANAIIGVTCHDSLSLAQKAEKQGASYVAFGAFFRSQTKPHAIPAPLTLLQEARQQLLSPIVAIGGITVDNAHQVIAAGADMVAVVHSLFTAPSVTQQAQAFADVFK